MPHFNARDATFRGCRCHTWTTTKCGIGLAEVWHWRRSGVAFTPLRCGVLGAWVRCFVSSTNVLPRSRKRSRPVGVGHHRGWGSPDRCAGR